MAGNWAQKTDWERYTLLKQKTPWEKVAIVAQNKPPAAVDISSQSGIFDACARAVSNWVFERTPLERASTQMRTAQLAMAPDPRRTFDLEAVAYAYAYDGVSGRNTPQLFGFDSLVAVLADFPPVEAPRFFTLVDLYMSQSEELILSLSFWTDRPRPGPYYPSFHPTAMEALGWALRNLLSIDSQDRDSEWENAAQFILRWMKHIGVPALDEDEWEPVHDLHIPTLLEVEGSNSARSTRDAAFGQLTHHVYCDCSSILPDHARQVMEVSCRRIKEARHEHPPTDQDSLRLFLRAVKTVLLIVGLVLSDLDYPKGRVRNQTAEDKSALRRAGAAALSDASHVLRQQSSSHRLELHYAFAHEISFLVQKLRFFCDDIDPSVSDGDAVLGQARQDFVRTLRVVWLEDRVAFSPEPRGEDRFEGKWAEPDASLSADLEKLDWGIIV